VRGDAFVGERPLDGGHPGAAASYPYQLAEVAGRAPFRGAVRGAARQDPVPLSGRARRAAADAVAGAGDPRLALARDHGRSRARARPGSAPYVRGVATFYTMYNKQPVGQYLIQVCTNVCCNLCGADEVMESFLEHTGTEAGETSADGRFTVIEAECLGACGFPTAVQINERYFENVDARERPGDPRTAARRDAAAGRGGGRLAWRTRIATSARRACSRGTSASRRRARSTAGARGAATRR
jgi:hypothetical protein